MLGTAQEEQNSCDYCGKLGSLKCNRCGSVTYCSKDHKRKHWNEHVSDCKSYKIKITPEAGQFVVASRNLIAGNEIMVDEPLLIGPLGTSDLICLSCCRPITDKQFYKCTDCSWPMCSQDCANSEAHDDECNILMTDEEKSGPPTALGETPRYDLIIILRCLIMKNKNDANWKEILKMESHWESKKSSSEVYHQTAVKYLMKVCGSKFDEDTIHHVRGALATNCLQIRGPYGSQLRAIYPNIRLFNHSCHPNVHLSSTADGTMKAKAAVDIMKDQELNISYTPVDCPYLERQSILLDSYYFTCRCIRCVDPTELGTYFSNPKCFQCKVRILIPVTNVIDSSVKWTCVRCKVHCSNDDILQETREWLFRLEMNDLFGSGTPLKICQALRIVEKSFHSKHYMYLKTCQLALQKLFFDTSLEALKVKKDIWNFLLQIYSILEPGITKRRGMTLCELATATYNYGKAGHDQKELTQHHIRNLYVESIALYNEAYHILKQEPRDNPEAKHGMQLLTKMEQIDLLLNNENHIEN